jgi:hypothetical protein
MPKAKPGNFTLKVIAKKVPAALAAHRFSALQKSGQYSELRFVQRGKAFFNIVGYKWPDKSTRRKLGIGRARVNPRAAGAATPNQVTFGMRDKTKIGWIHSETPTKYEVAYKDGPRLRTVMRDKNKVKFVLPKKANRCPKTANPDLEKARQLSKTFHHFDPRYKQRRQIEWPTAMTALGACAQIDYVTDKIDGKTRQYYHKFGRGCRVYAAPKPQKNGDNLIVILGPFKIRNEGLVG